MPTKEEQLKIIQEVFGNKDLTFGCKIKDKRSGNEFYLGYSHMDYYNDSVIYDIIGHDVMIGRFILVLNNNGFNVAVGGGGKIILNQNKDGSYKEIIWDNLDKSIEHQSDECIQYIYDLAISILDSKDK